ncbi:EVE domain-containing protein [uncultured Methanobacterium sp.]|uniref:EVE domain-containing protein n=1 Tax=uncultured Methanobacterium sp. TaxID=176306 RepID=UPI0028058E95|nr:EVE domain-containing protein [uncultured Methanobacterium sp.]
MSKRNYWLDLFTGTTWNEFLEAGGKVSGFRESQWNTVKKIKPGDYLLCYLTGLSRWIGILEVISEPYKDDSKIWSFDSFPCRMNVKMVSGLTPETAVPIKDLKDKLSIFEDLKSPNAWTAHVRSSPRKWKVFDGDVVVKAVQNAQKNPINRPFNPAKLKRKPRGMKTKKGTTVTVPTEELEPAKKIANLAISPEPEPVSDSNPHTEIQWMLLKLGNDMGLDVWVARNDRNKSHNGNVFSELPRIKDSLPLQFDEVTNKTIELIDVLWLQGNAITAAFEIESTTSIYSGLLRMSDLISMQPNLTMPLYIVAPDERRDKVIREVNRPTFARLSPPLAEICRYIPFSILKSTIPEIESMLSYLKPDYLDELSESCEIEDI